MLDKLFLIVSHNISFWILIISTIIFGFVIKLIFKRKVMWQEASIQVVASCLVIFVMYMVFFQTTSGIGDYDIRNGYVQSSEYYEEWTERCTRTVCTGSGENESCHEETYYVHHAPYWVINTSIGESINISKDEYKKYVNRFRNEKEVSLFRMSQSSFGDGDKYVSNYTNNATVLMPTSKRYTVVNYLKGSNSIKKRFGNMRGFEKYLLAYPQVHNEGWGNIAFTRVVTASVPVPQSWINSVDYSLDYGLSFIGVTKQVNSFVYLVNTKDQKFIYALEEFWTNARKNDVIVVIGTTNFPEIDWVDVIAWSKDETFKVMLKERLSSINLSDPNLVAGTILSQINLPPQKGGFERLRMRDLEYLVSDITLPPWIQILIIFIGVGVNVGIAFYMVRNDTEE